MSNDSLNGLPPYRLHYYRVASPAYVGIVADMLREVGARVSVIGRSVEGRAIRCVTIPATEEPLVKVLIIAGIHGNEPAPVQASLALARELLGVGEPNPNFDLRELRRFTEVSIVPLANPDGLFRYYSSGEWRSPGWEKACEPCRVNAAFVDLNRDWAYLTQPETRALHSLLARIKPHVVLDLHEFYARGGCPPRWANETEGFLVTLTDAPYAWVAPEIRGVSHDLMTYVGKALDAGLSPWGPVKTRHFSGGGSGEEVLWAPPNYLGTHAPLEGSAKLLVETWGVGLGEWMMHDRVTTHVNACLTALEYVASNAETLAKVKEAWVKHDESLINKASSQTFIIKGEESEVRKALKVLELHGVNHEQGTNGSPVIKLPQPGVTATALALLDRECELNRELRRRRRGPYLLSRFCGVRCGPYGR